LYNISTGEITRLTNNDVADEDPKFSPNGIDVVFKRNGDIYKIDLLLGTTLLRISRSNAILSLGLSSTGRTIITFDNKEKLLLNYSKTGGNYKELKMDLGEEITKHKPIEFNRHFLIASDKGTLYLVNKSYNIFPVLFIGTSALHSVQQINENEFLISNFDGKIIYITLQ